MFKYQDKLILVITTILTVLGLFTLVSTSIDFDGNIDWTGIVMKQAVFVALGVLLYIAVARIDITYLWHIQVIAVIYLVTLSLLIATLAFAPAINNAKRWILIGGTQFQPSEIAKVTVILVTIGVISLRDKYNEVLLAVISLILVLPLVVLIYLQPHGSMALILLILWFITAFTFMSNQLRNGLLVGIVVSLLLGGVLFAWDREITALLLVGVGTVAGIYGIYSKESWRKMFLVALLIGFVGAAVVAAGWDSFYEALPEHQKDRIEVFQNPEEADEDKSFNVRQSKVAIGSGQLFGKGFGFGTQTRLKFLPEHQTDFIFATFSEQFGWIGSMIVLGLYFTLIARIFWHAVNDRNSTDGWDASAVLLAALGFKIMIEVFINIGSNTGVIPATGIPLPLMSAGGTVTLMTFVTLGLVQSVISYSAKHPKEVDFIDHDDHSGGL
ncbi:MAG: rod shape-determining protein RodA [Candidatus Dojkabacteria bacterium]|nr:MAG: rod shape-determining protein RodA [Candidatus Dojkabacteria bacterium]